MGFVMSLYHRQQLQACIGTDTSDSYHEEIQDNNNSLTISPEQLATTNDSDNQSAGLGSNSKHAGSLKPYAIHKRRQVQGSSDEEAESERPRSQEIQFRRRQNVAFDEGIDGLDTLDAVQVDNEDIAMMTDATGPDASETSSSTSCISLDRWDEPEMQESHTSRDNEETDSQLMLRVQGQEHQVPQATGQSS